MPAGRHVLAAVLLVVTVATTAAATGSDRLAVGTDAEVHGPEEPVRLWVENRGETVFHGSVEVAVHRVDAEGACETAGYDPDCPRVARLYPGHVSLDPGERLAPAATWEKTDERGRAQGNGSYVARLAVPGVSTWEQADEVRFALDEGQGHGPPVGLVGPQPSATYTRELAFSWWARDPDGLRAINTSLTNEEGLGAIFLDHRGPDSLPEDDAYASGGGRWSIPELGRLGANRLGMWVHDRSGNTTQAALFDVNLAHRNVTFEPARPSFRQGETVRLNVTNTGTVTLEGPARWNVSGHRNPDADGWMHREPTHRFAPLEPGQTRQLTWDGRRDDGTPAPAGEYAAYVGVRGHLASTSFEIEPGNDTSDEQDREDDDTNRTDPETNRTVPDTNQTDPHANRTDPDTNRTDPDVNRTVPDDNRTSPEPNASDPRDGNVTIRVGGNASLTTANATIEASPGASTDPASGNGSLAAGTTIRYDGEDDHVIGVHGATARQGERNVLLEDADGRRVLVIAPTADGRVHVGEGHLTVSGSDRAIVRELDPDDPVDQALVPAWLAGDVGAEIDASGAAPTVSAYGDLRAETEVVDDGEGDPRLEIELTSPSHRGRLVAIALPDDGDWTGNLTVRLDGDTLPSNRDLAALANATGQDPGWTLVEHEDTRTLVVSVDHFSTRTLSIAPTASVGWLPIGLAASFVLAVAAILVLARD